MNINFTQMHRLIITLLSFLLIPILTYSTTYNSSNANFPVNIHNGDTLIVDSNDKINSSDFNNTIGGVLIMMGNSEIDVNNTLNINSGGKLIMNDHSTINVNGSDNITVNGELIVYGLATIQTNGQGSNPTTLTINSSGVVENNGLIDVNNLTINGALYGTGDVTYNNLTLNSSGTIGGISYSNQPSNPNYYRNFNAVFDCTNNTISLGSIITTWDGNSWDNGTPNQYMLAVIDGYYQTDLNGDIDAFILTVYDTLFISDSTVVNSDILVIDVLVIVKNNSVINTFTSFGNGSIKLFRETYTNGWHHYCFPINDTNIVIDNIFTNFPFNYTPPVTSQTNVYNWQDSVSGWFTPNTNFRLYNNNINIFTFNQSDTIELNIAANELNLTEYPQPVYYDAPIGNPTNANGWNGVVSDGWNMISNPYQKFIKVDLLDLNGFDGAVYMWDPILKNYTSRVNGVGQLEYIAPNQAFFIRRVGSDTTFTVKQNSTVKNIPTTSNKTSSNDLTITILTKNNELINGFVPTIVTVNPNATKNFDQKYDSYHYNQNIGVATKNGHFENEMYQINAVPIIDTVFIAMNGLTHLDTFKLSISNLPNDFIVFDLLTHKFLKSDSTFIYNEGFPVRFVIYNPNQVFNLNETNSLLHLINPNPFNEYISVNFIGDVTIYDTKSNIVYQGYVDEKQEINLSKLNRGVYYLKYKNSFTKIIKQ